MRHLFSFILLFCCTILIAQGQTYKDYKRHRKLVRRSAHLGHATYSMDTIYKAGKAEFVLKQAGRGNFNVYDFGGQHVLAVNGTPITGAYYSQYSEYIFVPKSNEVAYIGLNANWDQIQKTLLGNSIFEKGYFNRKNWETFLKVHAMSIYPMVERTVVVRSTTPVYTINVPAGYEGKQLAERDRSQPVSIVDEEVIQDRLTIGTFSKTQEAREELLYDIYRFYYLSGQVSFTVHVPLEGAPKSVVFLPNDGGSLNFQTQKIQVILADLVAKNYL